MPSRSDVTYFGAGPAALPTPVLEAASQALLNYNSTGVGLAEHSHRSPLANDILRDTKTRLKTLLDVPDDYDILFMQGGGSGEFSAVVYNLVGVWVERRRRKLEKEITANSPDLPKEDVNARVLEQLKTAVREELKVDYLVTGSWSLKSSQEAARLIGPEHVNVAVDARQSNNGKFLDIPGEEEWKLTPSKKEGGTGAAYVYFCDNETVDGVEFPSFPKCLERGSASDDEDEPIVVADMSSNMLSRRVQVEKYSVIFVSRHRASQSKEEASSDTLEGGCPKKRWVHRPHSSHHSQIFAATRDRHAFSRATPEPRSPCSSGDSGLRRDSEEQLPIQHAFHL